MTALLSDREKHFDEPFNVIDSTRLSIPIKGLNQDRMFDQIQFIDDPTEQCFAADQFYLGFIKFEPSFRHRAPPQLGYSRRCLVHSITAMAL